MASPAAAESFADSPAPILNSPGKPAKTVVCVFCGSSPGKSPAHLAAARSLAEVFHKANICLVYGGGTAGLMGEVAKTLVSLSGPDAVHGVIPSALIRHEAQAKSANDIGGATTIDDKVYGKTTVVKDMHERKGLMAKEVLLGAPGSGFVALSGGFGTMEELMEVTAWNQLGIHDKPVVLYNVEGYWDGLVQWVTAAVQAGFIGEGNKGIIAEGKTAEEVLDRLKTYENAEGRFKLTWEKSK